LGAMVRSSTTMVSLILFQGSMDDRGESGTQVASIVELESAIQASYA
jgi:hypothetical protein